MTDVQTAALAILQADNPEGHIRKQDVDRAVYLAEYLIYGK